MKFLPLIFLCIVISLHAAHSQSNGWFKTIGYGERTFSHSRIAVKAFLRPEADAVHGNLFTGRLIYMYLSDTAPRLVKKINGELHDKNVSIITSEDAYRMDPRSRSFRSDCSQYCGVSCFYIENGVLVLQITSAASGDTCNGISTFSKKLVDYDAGTQAAVARQFGGNTAPVAFASYTLPRIDTTGNPSGQQQDSLKYFPSLLNDSMRVHFDHSKYTLPKSLAAVDTVSTPKVEAALNKPAKQAAMPKREATKDSVAVNKKPGSSSSATATAKPSTRDSMMNNDNTQQKDTAPAIAKAISKTPLNPPATKPVARDTTAALPTPIKDTVPAAITQRATSLVTTYQVSSPHIAIQLFDDGQIDGDAVSVYYNGKVIINNQTLTHKATTFTLEATAANRHHEFILISESEGFLAPNTALMRIKAGSQQFELTVSSSSARNAKIVIDYTGE